TLSDTASALRHPLRLATRQANSVVTYPCSSPEDLEAALKDPEIMGVALEILDKARRRHSAHKR
ncbi:hypothetical protein ACFYTQ_26050, partial [Nocardia sp. NPDC004068]|uniref:hypothetical protein n=1 Tax=Nocardia sp. NPDC004068 TaxID=3364303 RepID=UPI0036B3C186